MVTVTPVYHDIHTALQTQHTFFDFDFDFDFDLQAAHTSRERLPRARTKDVVVARRVEERGQRSGQAPPKEDPPRPFRPGTAPRHADDASSHLPGGEKDNLSNTGES